MSNQEESQNHIPRFFKPGSRQELVLLNVVFRKADRETMKIGYHTFKQKAEVLAGYFWLTKKKLDASIKKHKFTIRQNPYENLIIRGVVELSGAGVSELKDFANLFPELFQDW